MLCKELNALASDLARDDLKFDDVLSSRADPPHHDKYEGTRPFLSDLKEQGWHPAGSKPVAARGSGRPHQNQSWDAVHEGQFNLQMSELADKSDMAIRTLWHKDLQGDLSMSVTEKMFFVWSWADLYQDEDFVFKLLTAYVSEMGVHGAALLIVLAECGAVRYSRRHRQECLVDYIKAILASPRRIMVTPDPAPKSPVASAAVAAQPRLVFDKGTACYIQATDSKRALSLPK